MWFKLTYSLAGMFIQRPGPEPETVIQLGEDREIKFWTRTFEDKNIQPHLCCDGVMHRDLNAKTLIIFESLSKRILPEESRLKVTLPYLEAGDLRPVCRSGGGANRGPRTEPLRSGRNAKKIKP